METNKIPDRIEACYEVMKRRVDDGFNADAIFATFKLFFQKELKEAGLEYEYDHTNINKHEKTKN